MYIVDNIRELTFYIMEAKRPGSRGETSRLNFRGEATRGETTWGKWFGGETSCYL